MKKITLFLFLIAFFAACSNDSKPVNTDDSGNDKNDDQLEQPATSENDNGNEASTPSPEQSANQEQTSSPEITADNTTNTITKDATGKEKKRYHIKSGIVEFKISGSNISGKKFLYFDKWGMRENEDRTSIVEMEGQKQEMHDARILKDGWGYMVNYDRKEMMKIKDPALTMAGDKDMVDFSKELMTSMGGKLLGNEKVAGYDCEKWEIMGQKTWLHKGVILKTEVEMGGMKMVEEAVKVNFNVPVPDAKFVVPADFKVVESSNPMADMTEEEFNAEMEKLKNISFEDFKKMMDAAGEKIDDMEKAYDEFKKYVNSRVKKE